MNPLRTTAFLATTDAARVAWFQIYKGKSVAGPATLTTAKWNWSL